MYDEDRAFNRQLNDYLEKRYGDGDTEPKERDPDFYREEGEC